MSNATNNQASTGQDVSLSDQLRQFTGTEHWYQHPFVRSVTYTDGVKYFAEKAGAYWFIDEVIIGHTELMKDQGFLTITLNVSDELVATLTIDDGNDNVLVTREIPYTDCPVGTYRFYFTDNVLLLPSEY
jgi:hypothetical protein